MGKPRRCSPAFFAEERAELSRKRQKIRMLQQRKQADVNNFKDLPENIPLQLTIGARVTARWDDLSGKLISKFLIDQFGTYLLQMKQI